MLLKSIVLYDPMLTLPLAGERTDSALHARTRSAPPPAKGEVGRGDTPTLTNYYKPARPSPYNAEPVPQDDIDERASGTLLVKAD
ncbi:Uncharacterised protein [Hafnia alvei]|uniref:Uncharacterized protein n=1 Tax=Hafnia alvei TaxID=569 RepID=A0A377PG44_HAFAL|nr:Uncharacterised protein [Hafnia alvei]